MGQKITKNIFSDGVDKDTHPKYVQGTKVTDSQNVIYTGDGQHYTPTNIAETTEVAILKAASNFDSADTIKVLGSRLATFQLAGSPVDCQVVWALGTKTAADATYGIYAYDIVGDTVYTLYEQAYTLAEANAILANDPYLDAIVDTENNIDYILFTDTFHRPMRIKCLLDTLPYTEESLRLQRYAAPTATPEPTIVTGGKLLAGGYVAMYRLFNNVSNLYTMFSPPSQIAMVATADETGAVGAVTSHAIEYTIAGWNTDIADEFTHIQWAVIPLNDGSTELPIIGFTLPIEAITVLPLTKKFSDNEYQAAISVGELVTEQAAITDANSIQVTRNRAFLGGITYSSLDYDVNTGPVVSGSIQKVAAEADDPTTAPRGYFRNEVYRFYTSCYDEHGNYSRPKILDLNGITDNQISGSLKDLKFPKRDADGAWTVLNSSSIPQALYLRITTMTDFPTWSVGFVILRAKRKKNILFQTPMIPGIQVQSAGALGDYPQLAQGETQVDTDRQIKSSVPIYTPKNLFHPLSRDIIRDEAGIYSSIEDEGEVNYAYYGAGGTEPATWFMFPPDHLYTQSGFTSLDRYDSNSGQQVDVVDLAVLKLDATEHSSPPSSEKAGNYTATSVSGTFYATDVDDYYYHPLETSKADLWEENRTIRDYVPLTQGEELGGVITSSSPSMTTSLIGSYASIEVETLEEGAKPINQQSGVLIPGMTISQPWLDPTAEVFNSNIHANATTGYYNNIRSDASGARAAWPGIDYRLVSATTSLGFADFWTNDFVFENTNYSTTSYVQAAWIANILAGNGDDRYGPDDTFHEMIPVAQIGFEETDLPSVKSGVFIYTPDIDIFEGDCYVAPHTFKVHDSVHVVANTLTTDVPGTTQTKRWGYSFDTGSTIEMQRPIPVTGAAGLVTVYLESEINPWWTDRTNYYEKVSTKPAFKAVAQADIRQPMDYNYNPAFSLENTFKVFVPFSEDDINTTEYPARAHFSNLRVYQSNLEGFDTFFPGDFHDMDETLGPIYSLPKARDNMYALQQDACAYLPIGERVIEQATGANLAIRSGDVINTPVYLSTKYGTSDPKTVQINNNDQIFFLDRTNQKIVRIDGQQYELISNIGMSSEFNRILKSSYLASAKKVDTVGFYYEPRQEYWIGARPSTAADRFLWAWNDRANHWAGVLPHLSESEDQMTSFIMYDDKAYGVTVNGASAGNLSTGLLYDAATYYDGQITFLINADPEYVKTFDNIIFNSTGASGGSLQTMELRTYRDAGLPLQTQLSAQTLSGSGLTREDIHKVKILRDSNGARLRGTYLEVVMKWDSNTASELVPLTSFMTKYRLSKRID